MSFYRHSSPFDLAPPAGGERPTAGASHPVVSPRRRLALLWGQPVYDAATRTTGRVRSDASPNYLGGECEIRIRTYVGFPGFLTRPTGVLDLQLSRRTDHVETWSPPYVCSLTV